MDKRNISISISVIIPVYNVEKYLPVCIDSLMHQDNTCLEIILINDGSTDRSGAIADQYALQDNRIKVVHKENGGASTARNVGLDLAQGEYIVFLDSDDWLKENSLCELYHVAAKHQVDVLMGKLLFCLQDGRRDNPYCPVPNEILHIPLSGKECFIQLVKAKAYPPMACNYMFRKSYLDKIQARFEEGIMAEDELWSPIVLCQSEKMIVTNIEFYFYRQQEESVMHTTNLFRRLNSLFRVTDKLFEFTDRFDFSGDDGELKNWLYVNNFKLYSITFKLASRLKDSSYVLPKHHLDCFWRDCQKMMPEPLKICRKYYQDAEKNYKIYTEWRISDSAASVPYHIKVGKKLMLIYNIKFGLDLNLGYSHILNDWAITTDRRFFQQADVVVFYLPDMPKELEYDLDKRQGQIWVAWLMEAEKNYPWIKDPQIMNMFDLWMGHQHGVDVLYPYYQYDYINHFKQNGIDHKQNRVFKSIFDGRKDKDNREYLTELMNHIKIDTNSGLYNHIQFSEEYKIKLNFYRRHKFVIAFEDAIETDYVTEKFYDPLVAGSVPIYLGAPNIEDFAPGDNCFVDVRKFEDPKSLANFINACYDDEQLYSKFFEWKNKPLKQSFIEKAEVQKEHPLVRLCRKVDDMLL